MEIITLILLLTTTDHTTRPREDGSDKSSTSRVLVGVFCTAVQSERRQRRHLSCGGLARYVLLCTPSLERGASDRKEIDRTCVFSARAERPAELSPVHCRPRLSSLLFVSAHLQDGQASQKGVVHRYLFDDHGTVALTYVSAYRSDAASDHVDAAFLSDTVAVGGGLQLQSPPIRKIVSERRVGGGYDRQPVRRRSAAYRSLRQAERDRLPLPRDQRRRAN